VGRLKWPLTEWAELVKVTELGLFAGPEWFARWEKAFAPGRLHYVLATRGGRLVGLLPVVPDGRKLRSATNSETARYSPVLVEPALVVDIVKALASCCRQNWMVTVRQLWVGTVRQCLRDDGLASAGDDGPATLGEHCLA